MTLETMGMTPFFQQQTETLRTQTGLSDIDPVRVTGVRKNAFIVSDGTMEQTVTVSGTLLYEAERGLFPVTGDWALLQGTRIVAVLTRKNELSRGAAGSRGTGRDGAVRGQVIAANIDTVFIVCGLDGDYSPRRIERYITLVYNSGANPVVILTKSDLHEVPERFSEEIETIAFGVPVHTVSALSPDGADVLRQYLMPGQTAAMIGSSGAGKSTLLNRLAGTDLRKTGGISDRVGKGVHTTTSRDLFCLPEGGMIIDNPGIREVAFWDDNRGIDVTFPDIRKLALQCRFSDCSHLHEPGCAVLRAVADGALASDRLSSFLKMQREFDYLAQRETKTPERIEKERWKDISVLQKKLKKRSGI